jgi:hypothetical protein
MNLDWLHICAAGEQTPCVAPVQVAYLLAVLVGAVVLTLIAIRSRDLANATLALMAVAIAINIAVGSLISALKLPIYLDSIGTVLVGVLAGPWAGALTGLLANLIWSILPVPGGAGPTIAFFAPVAAVIGLMAGFYGGRGVFRLRADDDRVGAFLALAAGVAASAVVLFVIQQTVGLAFSFDDPDSQTRFVTLGIVIIAVGVAVAWISGRTVFAFKAGDTRITRDLTIATAIAAFAIVFGILRLLFSPSGYFSTLTGAPDSAFPGTNLSGLALADPIGLAGMLVIGLVGGYGAWAWARRGENARLFPVWIAGLTTGLVAAAISAPISAGVFGGVTGSGTDLLVALYRTLGLNTLQSAFAQGLTSDPLDKTLSYTIVYAILIALPLTIRVMFARSEATVSA